MKGLVMLNVLYVVFFYNGSDQNKDFIYFLQKQTIID